MPTVSRIFLCLTLCTAVIGAQYAFDLSLTRNPTQNYVPPATLVRSLDLGLHSAVASFLWLTTRTELPFLPQGPEHFLAGVRLINDLDSRFSAPYVFTLLVLPSVSHYPDRVPEALAVGERGLASADPNWQIPFYMGSIYQLELNDRQNAARYYDLAATTPGVPEPVRRFALNYGISPESLAATAEAWTLIYRTATDPTVQQRAAAHLAHLEIVAKLNAALQAFFASNGRYPGDLEEMVRTGFLPALPQDPLGFTFQIYPQGIAGIAPQGS